MADIPKFLDLVNMSTLLSEQTKNVIDQAKRDKAEAERQASFPKGSELVDKFRQIPSNISQGFRTVRDNPSLEGLGRALSQAFPGSREQVDSPQPARIPFTDIGREQISEFQDQLAEQTGIDSAGQPILGPVRRVTAATLGTGLEIAKELALPEAPGIAAIAPVVGVGKRAFMVKGDKPMFRSKLAGVIDNIKQDKMSAQQAEAAIRKGGARSEVEISGITEFLKNKKGSVTKDELLDYVEENGVRLELEVRVDDIDSPTLPFKQYSTPGGTGYKESFSKVPGGTNRFANPHPEFPDNVAVHTRSSLFDTPTGRTLNIAEVQSDWAQKGRQLRMDEVERLIKSGVDEKEALKRVPSDFGYNIKRSFSVDDLKFEPIEERSVAGLTSRAVTAITDSGRPVTEIIVKRGDKFQIMTDGSTASKNLDDVIKIAKKRVADNFGKSPDGIPNTPFKNTDEWTTIGVGQELRRAAEEGVDNITWDHGKIQIDRYDEAMRQNVDEINWSGGYPETDSVLVRADKNGNHVFDAKFDPETGKSLRPLTIGNKTEVVHLRDVVGKDAARKIMDGGESGVLQGDDLAIGGDGMKGYYGDELGRAPGGGLAIMPKTMLKILKKMGFKDVKIEMMKVRSGNTQLNTGSISPQGHIIHDTVPNFIELPGIRLTPEMRKKIVEEGIPLSAIDKDTSEATA